jgi:enoyl-CoA hydratase/carnithine racemase
MTYKTLLIDRRGPVEWLTLNRPDSLNALSPPMIEELDAYFTGLSARPDVRVVTMRGAGRGFCAGLDLKAEHAGNHSVANTGVAGGLKAQRAISRIVMAMRACPQPIIALVHGAACGGGFALALAADIRIAGTSARMNCAFIRLGLGGCDIGASYFLPRLVGVSVASELILTGRFIEAARAERVGLVSEVVADEALEAAAAPYVEAMLTTAPLGLRLTKDCLNFSIDAPSLQAAVAMEDRNQILCAQTSDFREGVASFLEKRAPAWTDG